MSTSKAPARAHLHSTWLMTWSLIKAACDVERAKVHPPWSSTLNNHNLLARSTARQLDNRIAVRGVTMVYTKTWTEFESVRLAFPPASNT